MRPQPAPKSDAIWQMLRVALRPLTARELAEMNDVSAVRARRALRLWAQAGYLTRIKDEHDSASRYAVTEGAPIHAPMIATDGQVEPREGAMRPEEMAALRRLSGLSLRDFAAKLGMKGTPESRSRAMRRYETGKRPIGAALAEAARASVSNEK
jgi:DNA-binding transcriptional regulator YiaG